MARALANNDLRDYAGFDLDAEQIYPRARGPALNPAIGILRARSMDDKARYIRRRRRYRAARPQRNSNDTRCENQTENPECVHILTRPILMKTLKIRRLEDGPLRFRRTR
jgi:hypothetical protein